MGVVAELSRLAVCSWAPSGSHIAAGTYAGAIDTSFESSSSLELLALDAANGRLIPGPAVRQPEKFSAIAWGQVSRAHVAGLVAGGLNDGTVRVWDAASLLRPTNEAALRDPNRGLLFTQSAAPTHKGPVHGLSFNQFAATLLASGGADGQVLIWDLSTGSKPAVHAPGTSEAVPKDEIVAVLWNPKVQHILGTGSSSGVLSVWDLRTRKQVISVPNRKGRFRASSLVWHPSIVTQILVACDEDDGPGAQLWDLRNATAPLQTLAHHAPRGILSAAWCPHDPDLLLTTSRDGRSTIVSPADGSLIVELPKSSTWNFNVQWSPKSAGLYLASSFDGRISLSSILTANAAPSVSAETAHALAESFGPDAGDFKSGMALQSPRASVADRGNVNMARTPKWLCRPSVISFGFGGRSLVADLKSGNTVTVRTSSDNFPSDKALVSADEVLGRAVATDPTPLAEFCAKAASEAANSTERMAWEVLGLQFQPDSRRKLLEYLGYSVSAEVVHSHPTSHFGMVNSPPLASAACAGEVSGTATSNTESITPAENLAPAPLSNGVSDGLQGLSLDGPAPWDIAGGTSLGSENANILDDELDNGGEAPSSDTDLKQTPEQDSEKRLFAGMGERDVEDSIKRSVIAGDFASAVKACFHVNRPADALLIAHVGGSALWEEVQKQYLNLNVASNGARICCALSGPTDRMDELLEASCEDGKDDWKDALAVIVTYAKNDEFANNCSSLGHRLLAKENVSAALICFICACNTRMSTTLWLRVRPASGKFAAAFASRLERLMSVVAKIRIASAAVALANGEQDLKAIRAHDDLSATVLLEYGAILAKQGDLHAASRYLSGLDPNTMSMYGSASDLQAQVFGHLGASVNPDLQYSSDPYSAPSQGYGNAQMRISDSLSSANEYSSPFLQHSSQHQYPGMFPSQPDVSGANVPGSYAPSYVSPSAPPSMPSSMPPSMPPPLQPFVPPPAQSFMPPPTQPSAPPPMPPTGQLSIPPLMSPSAPPSTQSPVRNILPAPAPPPPPPPPQAVGAFTSGMSPASVPSTNPQKIDGPSHSFYPNLSPTKNASVLESSSHNGYSVSSQPAQTVPPAPSISMAAPPPPPNLLSSGLPYNGTQSVQVGGSGKGAAMDPMTSSQSTLLNPQVPFSANAPTTHSYDGKAVQMVNNGNPALSMPPPPPSVPDSTSAPRPFFPNAVSGAGASLPPSSEIAVAKQRMKAPSSSGVPGGMPRRSPSASSSLSSMGTDVTMPIDRVDVSSIPAEQQIIVKALREAFQYVASRSSSMMFKKRCDDISKKLGRLLYRLNARDMEQGIVQKLIIVAQAISKGDFGSARIMTTSLSKEVDWESDRHWIQALHHLIDSALSNR